MRYTIYHCLLLTIMAYTIVSTMMQFVAFLSSQGLLGYRGLHYPILRSKRITQWTESERRYVMQRLLWDCGLIGVFILHHSVMATCWAKNLLRCCLCIRASERLLYVISSCSMLHLVMSRWLSVPDARLWFINTQCSNCMWFFFTTVHTITWILLIGQIALMEPCELVGYKQVMRYIHYKAPPACDLPKGLRTFYEHMRHPGPTLLGILMWVHPVMSLDRVVLASLLTMYMFVAFKVTRADRQLAASYFERGERIVEPCKPARRPTCWYWPF